MRGTDPDLVADALTADNPFPGTSGFAGELPDGRLVRDVLGRELCYYDEAAAADAADVESRSWSHDPSDLDNPTLLPAGRILSGSDPERAWTLPDPPADDERPVERIQTALSTALDVDEGEGLAVAFSGGVDSALVASAVDAPLYVVGYDDATDIQTAKESAAAMSRDDLRVERVTLDDIEAAVPAVARAIGRTNAMDVQIALTLYLVARRVAADGFDRIALGQGADELFGGYAKVAKAPTDPRTDADTVRGARREVLLGLPDQLERDSRAIRAAGVEPVTPLLHDDVVREALTLPGEWLVNGDTRKRALRAASREWVPDEVATRDKKAVQYGSLVARELDRLARRAGFKRRMDDHVTKYVEYRLGERELPSE